MQTGRLVSLVIPGGWLIVKNQFAHEEPVIENGKIVNEEYYTEDLLSIERAIFKDGSWQNDVNSYCVDVGWRPVADPNGAYYLTFFEKDWNNILFQVNSKDRDFIRKAIERCLDYSTRGFSDDEIRTKLSGEFI